jgi:exopolysaccharide biosynthesis polyprenyl glycosylphosphotransferase
MVTSVQRRTDLAPPTDAPVDRSNEIHAHSERSAHLLRSLGKDRMTPQTATRLKLHDDEVVNEPLARRRLIRLSRRSSAPARDLGPVEVDTGVSAALQRREALHRRVLGGTDVCAAALALLLGLTWYGARHALVCAIVGVSIVVLLFKAAGLYDRDDLRLVHSTLDEVPLLLQLTGLVALGVAILQSGPLANSLRAGQIAALWLASFAALCVGRVGARGVAGRIAPMERCLVIGEPDRVERIRQKLASSQARAAVVGSMPMVGEDAAAIDSGALPGLFRGLVEDLNVHRIIIAPAVTDTVGVVNLIRAAKAVGVRVSVLPRMLEVVGSAVEFDDIDGMTMLGVRRFGLSRTSRMLKRAFDLVLVSIGLVLISPILIAIAIAIRADSRGPVFFRQIRVGRDGNHFRMFKFRSMGLDAEMRKDELRSLNEAGDGLFKIADDPRVTRVGRLLRRTSLDELPQLFNVLAGQMSLVGPRPLVVDEDAQVHGLDRSRLHLTPGMTGPWQILGYRVPIQEMVGLDYLYVANWSLWLDLKVLVRTVSHVARRDNL